MKVLHIVTGLGVGGAEQQLRLLLRRLRDRSVHCDVVALTEPGAVAEGIRADGTRVVHLGMRGNRDLSALPRLVRLIRAGRYDLVHTHLYRACVYGRIAARLAGVRTVVATEHSLGDRELEGRRLTPAVRALYLATERLGTATVAVSDTGARRLRRWGVPRARLHTVPNGIDADRFRFDPAARAAVRARLDIAADAFVVGGVGRLVPGKRFGVLVEAVAHLPGVRLLLAGDGPERAELLARAGALGAADRVRLLGACDGGAGAGGTRVPPAPAGAPGTPDVPGLLSAVDVCVSPSAEEAFGLAVLEALAAGLPVLYAACPAVEDLPPEQAPGARRVTGGPAELARALRELHEEHEKRAAQDARERPGGAPTPRLPVPAAVHHYDIARTAGELLAVYRSALGTYGPPSADETTAASKAIAPTVQAGEGTAAGAGRAVGTAPVGPAGTADAGHTHGPATTAGAGRASGTAPTDAAGTAGAAGACAAPSSIPARTPPPLPSSPRSLFTPPTTR